MKIKGYTLHGDYYLADEVITYTNWEEACEMIEEIILPNCKKITAHTLSKEELESIPEKERECGRWYWTNTSVGSCGAWNVLYHGSFLTKVIGNFNSTGGARLGFHKNEIKKQLLNIE
jgi:hypothetical protein